MAEAPTVHYEDMSPTLLARQPLTAPDQLASLSKGWSWGIVFDHLESRFNALRNWRWSWWAHWSMLATFILPRRYEWLVVANRYWRGSPINDAIVDGTGTQAMQTCASGMWSGLTNPARRWVKLGLFKLGMQGDEDINDPEAKAWFEDTEERLYTVLNESNFYDMMSQGFQDLTTFGTSPPVIYEDRENVIRLYLPCAGEYCLGVGGSNRVDVFYREFQYTVAQTVDFFGVENCPGSVKTLWFVGGGSLQNEFVICHAIEPNTPISGRYGGKPIYPVGSNFPFREVYWIKGETASVKPLSVRGFHEKPFGALRWSTVSNDAYGRGPGMDALGDIKQLQIETREKAEFIKKLTKPPMGADPYLKNEPASIIPGNITFMPSNNNGKGFWPLFEMRPEALRPMIEDIEKISNRIERAFFVDVFMAISRMEGVQPRNELELTKRDLERLQKLGPVIELCEQELAVMIRRIIGIMERKRLLKPLPESLQGKPLKIEFINISRLAQRAATGVAMNAVFTGMAAMSSASKAAGLPDPLRVIDLDKSARRYAEVNNFPADCVLTPDQVLEQDKARQQATEQAQMPEQAMAGVTAAKTLSETDLTPGNALSAIVGGPLMGGP